MQVAAGRGGAAAKDTDGEEQTGKAAVGAAKSKVVGAMMRKHLVEAGIPVLAELKRMLEAQRHRLLGPLMTTLQVLAQGPQARGASAHCAHDIRCPAFTSFQCNIQAWLQKSAAMVVSAACHSVGENLLLSWAKHLLQSA